MEQLGLGALIAVTSGCERPRHAGTWHDVMIDERTQADEAFAGNRLLSTFSREARALIEPFGTIVELESGDVVLNRGEQVSSSLFPLGPTMISMAVELSGGRIVEVALIGRRARSAGSSAAARRRPFHAPGARRGAGVPRADGGAGGCQAAARRLSSNLFCRFSDYLLSQVMQSVACNAFHSIPERAARWLLHAQDRTGDRIELTQEAFAGLLGVQRTTVNAVDPGAVRRRLDRDRPRRDPGHRPRRAQTPLPANVISGWRSISRP